MSQHEQEQQPQATSPLRGDLQDNAIDGDLHDMGGNVGPAPETSSATDEQPRGDRDAAPVGGTAATASNADPGTEGVERALAVNSNVPTVGRDDYDDPGGNDAGPTPVPGTGSDYVEADDIDGRNTGRGADGATPARVEQDERGGA